MPQKKIPLWVWPLALLAIILVVTRTDPVGDFLRAHLGAGFNKFWLIASILVCAGIILAGGTKKKRP